MKHVFNLSANIDNGFADGFKYIVTPNATKAIHNIVNDFKIGIHSFTIIGSYGTGKSSFLLALESDLQKQRKTQFFFNPQNITTCSNARVINIVGDYESLSVLLAKAINSNNIDNIFDDLRNYYNNCHKKNEFLLIVVDEFGKVLEYAAKNNPEKELYFIQKFTEFVNVSSRNILFLTTLHQNFAAYSKNLTETQINEWTKVKGRFKEITFVEPIEQILYLASREIKKDENSVCQDSVKQIYDLAKETRFISSDFSFSVAETLAPLDVFAANIITSAIQRYGQNERSLFTFLSAKGNNSISEFVSQKTLLYNIQNVYDYVFYNFHSYLKEVNLDSMSWSSIYRSIEKVEAYDWNSEQQMLDAVKIIKAIGLLNLFGVAGFKLSIEQLARYANFAMNIVDAEGIIEKLIKKKVVRYAVYKERLILFEGTDVDLELELKDAELKVSRPTTFVDDLKVFFNKRISPVKAHYYQKGTPRFFDYIITEEPLDINPTGDTDGFIELIFSTKKSIVNEIKALSSNSNNALIFAYFSNTKKIVDHLYNIKKYVYLIEKVIDSSDAVALSEIKKLKDYEENLLNKEISDNLFNYGKGVVWVFKGREQNVKSLRDFNQLLSSVCNKVYYKTPIMNNELFNKQKLSSAISTARKNYLHRLLNNYLEEDFGFPKDKFPPEKTIYFSLLKNTGLHSIDFADIPKDEGIMSLWEVSEQFLKQTENKAQKISEFIKILSSQPYKLKQGFIDFWIPTYLFIKRQDFALYDVKNGAFIPNINMEFFELLQKYPADFEVKKFVVEGVKLNFFNQYRQFINLENEFAITSENFIETIKPFFRFYARLNEYTKNTRKFDKESTLLFRDILAKATDPERTFFEDLPQALGYNSAMLEQDKFVDDYGKLIASAIKELRSCYDRLIDRIEQKVVSELSLTSSDYSIYIEEIKNRLSNVKKFLLTDKQKNFYDRVMSEYDNKIQWYQSICYCILDQKLDSLRDEQEEKLIDDLIFLLRSCERYADISKFRVNSQSDKAYSFDITTANGLNLQKQTYLLPEKDKKLSLSIEEKINSILSGDDNIDICTLLEVLTKRIKK